VQSSFSSTIGTGNIGCNASAESNACGLHRISVQQLPNSVASAGVACRTYCQGKGSQYFSLTPSKVSIDIAYCSCCSEIANDCHPLPDSECSGSNFTSGLPLGSEDGGGNSPLVNGYITAGNYMQDGFAIGGNCRTAIYLANDATEAPTTVPTLGEVSSSTTLVYATDSVDLPNSEWASLISTGSLIVRTCASCRDSHKTIVYKRLTSWGSIDIRDLFLSNWFGTPTGGQNVLNTDFELFGSVDDATVGLNKWVFCNYNDPGIGFPRDCGPSTYVPNQWNSVTRGGKKVSYTIETPAATLESAQRSSGSDDTSDTNLAVIVVVVVVTVMILFVVVRHMRNKNADFASNNAFVPDEIASSYQHHNVRDQTSLSQRELQL